MFLQTVKMAFSVEQKTGYFDTENNQHVDLYKYFSVLTETKKSKISRIPRPDAARGAPCPGVPFDIVTMRYLY
ncbi:TPA: hypothetical protein ACF9XW_003690 [Salmonella enterica subsp. enterica serovar Newport]